MKETTIELMLTRDHVIHKKHVTALEAMVLVALHAGAVGDCPVKLVPGKDGKPVLEDTTAVDLEKHTRLVDKRDVDGEIKRLKHVYGAKKISAMLAEVRELPGDDFEKAIKKGMDLRLPQSDAVASAKL